MDLWVGIALDQNSRDRMEDIVDVRLFQGGGIFIVLDGHNGNLALNFVAKVLSLNIVNAMESHSIDAALQIAFAQTEEALLAYLIEECIGKEDTECECMAELPILTSGVVACVVVLKGEDIYTAHVGDSRAVLGRKNFEALQLTMDHSMSNATERIRIETIPEGVSLDEGYVNGLMVTRSLGNVCCRTKTKCTGQIAIPTISKFHSVDDQFILIASDGLFEVFSNEAVVGEIRRAMMRPSFSPTKICQELVQRAISRGSCDNICACIILLDKR